MSNIGGPNESVLSYKNSHNVEQMCAKLRTLPKCAQNGGHDLPQRPRTTNGDRQYRRADGKKQYPNQKAGNAAVENYIIH